MRKWTIVLALMAVFVMSSSVVLANGKKCDGQKQIGEATAEVALTVIRTTGDDQGAQEIGLTEINNIQQVAFIHAPVGDANAITKLGADDHALSQIDVNVNMADTANTPSAVAVRKRNNQIYLGTVQKTGVGLDVGCGPANVAMFFGWRGSSSPPPLEVALFMGPPASSQATA